MSHRLYVIPLSHPALAARGMLEHKGLEHRVVELLGGAHPVVLRALGFPRATVPALRLEDGTRVQGSLEIARALEALRPDPPLYPADPERRRRVEEAERWGERELQPVPRRIIRRGLADHLRQRRWFADVATPLPAPGVTGAMLTPVVPFFVRQAGATEDRVRSDIAALPGLLDEVDRLLADGVIGGAELNAADFQIGTTVRMLLAFEDVGALIAGRPAEAHARRVQPDYPDIPAALPPEWLPALTPA